MAYSQRNSSSGCHRRGGTNHDGANCWYRDQKCNYCQKLGHKAKVCLKAARDRSHKPVGTNQGFYGNKHSSQKETGDQRRNLASQHQLISVTDELSDNDSEVATIKAIGGRPDSARQVTITVNNQQLKMELDTGSSSTVVDKQIWKLIGFPALAKAPSLTAYGGYPLLVLGQAEV